MPSKTVSFSDSGYIRIANARPDDKNFSEWVEELATDELDNRQNTNSEETEQTQ